MNHQKRRSSSLLWLVSLFHGPSSTNVYCHNSPALADAFSTRSQNLPRRSRSSLLTQPRHHFGRHSLHSSRLLASSTEPTSAPDVDCYLDPNFFLHQVETSVDNVLSQFPDHGNNINDQDNKNNNKAQKEFLLTLDGPQRESFGVAQNLHQRLLGLRKNNDCPRCWMQQTHCICKDTPPLQQQQQKQHDDDDDNDDVLPQLNRIFVIMHHKEIALKVDTAKLILAAFPKKCRLVVAGIGPEYQASMKELQEAMKPPVDGSSSNNKNCLVLFPDENAQSIQEILEQDYYGPQLSPQSNTNEDASQTTKIMESSSSYYKPYDLIVLDGTWAQARKIHTKYIPHMERGGPRRVQLSESAVETLQQANDQSGHQLRRHTVAWRQVGTYEATRLFLKDLEEALPAAAAAEGAVSTEPVWKQISNYQSIANEAARRELGPPRESQVERS